MVITVHTGHIIEHTDRLRRFYFSTMFRITFDTTNNGQGPYIFGMSIPDWNWLYLEIICNYFLLSVL